jgi:hypothetical protein
LFFFISRRSVVRVHSPLPGNAPALLNFLRSASASAASLWGIHGFCLLPEPEPSLRSLLVLVQTQLTGNTLLGIAGVCRFFAGAGGKPFRVRPAGAGRGLLDRRIPFPYRTLTKSALKLPTHLTFFRGSLWISNLIGMS